MAAGMNNPNFAKFVFSAIGMSEPHEGKTRIYQEQHEPKVATPTPIGSEERYSHMALVHLCIYRPYRPHAPEPYCGTTILG